MATFFPHLYEYSKAIALIKECEEKDRKQEVKAETPESQIFELISNDQCHRKRPQKLCKSDIVSKDKKRPVKFRKSDIIKLPKLSPQFQQLNQSNEIDNLIYLELKLQKLRESRYNPLKYYDENLEHILKNATDLSTADCYSMPKEWPVFSENSDFSFKQTNEYLMKRIVPEEMKRHCFIIDVVLCIEVFKTLPFVAKLDIADQREILKATALHNVSLVSAFYSFAAHYDTLYYPNGLIPIKFPIVHQNQYDVFKRVVEPITRIKMTKEEYVLLKIIIFCSAKSDSITEEGRKILQKEFHRYSNLLLKYCQAQLGAAPGAVRFSQLISVIEAMTYFAQKYREFHLFVGTIKPPNSTYKADFTLKLLDQLVI